MNNDKKMTDRQRANPGGQRVQLFMRRLRERFFLRFHMSLILLATGLSGLLASKLLLLLQLENIIIRYPLAVFCSYLAFFLFVKLWLAYISAWKSVNSSGTAGNQVFNLPDLSGGGAGPDVSLPKFGGGGGAAGGGGATGAFDGPMTDAGAALGSSSSGSADAVSGAGGSVGDAVSGIFDIDDDGIILIAIGVLLTAVFGASIYLVYMAPHVLSDAAFNFLLGTSLIRGYKKVNHPDWMGSVLRDTYIPFLCVLLITFAAACVIHSYAPDITKLSDLYMR